MLYGILYCIIAYYSTLITVVYTYNSRSQLNYLVMSYVKYRRIVVL